MANVTWYEIRRYLRIAGPSGSKLTEEKPLKYDEALKLAEELNVSGEGVDIWMMTFSGATGRISGAVVHTIKPSQQQEAA